LMTSSEILFQSDHSRLEPSARARRELNGSPKIRFETPPGIVKSEIL
jgi:hypothetical protein